MKPPDGAAAADADDSGAAVADIALAAGWIADAGALVVAAGAGFGVDSGLPDFRGAQGFWRAYPALGRRGLSFAEAANPRWFDTDPALAWGFYGHRLALYRRTRPHAGFDLLRRWGGATVQGVRVFTSNVDGQFQRAGIDAVAECHGSIHHLQCSRPCGDAIWPADGFDPEVDEAECRLVGPAPRCPRCGAVARPNILMFGDGAWLGDRTARQESALDRWLDAAQATRRLVVVEAGAGTAVATVRRFSQSLCAGRGARLVRINIDAADAAVPRSIGVGLAGGALATLLRIDRAITALRG